MFSPRCARRNERTILIHRVFICCLLLNSKPTGDYYNKRDSSEKAGGTGMNVFGIGLPEMVLILVVALLVFGPKKLPEIGRSVGKALRSFQDASKDFEAEFKREAEQIEKTVSEPMTATLESSQPTLAPAESVTEPAANSVAEPVTEEAISSSDPQEVAAGTEPINPT
jgi:sec-independent protein translocase protein TatA